MNRLNNGGYIGHSKSVRAVQAEYDGLLKKSEINKSLILNAYKKSDEYDEEKYNHYKSLSAKAFKALIKDTGASEWHHTGKYYKKTNYYSIDEIVDNIEYLNDYEEFKISKEQAFLNKLEEVKSCHLTYVTHTTLIKINRYKWESEQETYKGIWLGDWIHTSGYKKFKAFANSNSYRTINFSDKKALKEFLGIKDLRSKKRAMMYYYNIAIEKLFKTEKDRKKAYKEIKKSL